MLNNNILSPSRSDFILVLLLRAVAAIAGVITVLIFFFLLMEALPTLRIPGVMPFFTDASWNPTQGLFNLSPMLWGTLYASAGAVLIAAPLGVLSAVYCHYYGHTKLVWLYRRIIELLAGIPSVVYGFWGLMVLVPWIANYEPPGASLLAGILILAIMILPTMALAADAAFAAVPAPHLRGAAALGLSRWTTISRVVLPSIRSALFTGLLLQTGRAIGETMAVLMVCGNVVQTPDSLFQPMRTLASNIALEMAYAVGSHRSALFVSGVVLIFMITILVAAAEGVRVRSKHV